LFILPAYEKRGKGQQLQRILLNWYFSHTHETVWLETNQDTRAEAFYRKSEWNEAGIHGDGEIKFEMTYRDWMEMNQSNTHIE